MPVGEQMPTIIARRVAMLFAGILSHVKPLALDSERSVAGGVTAVMIHLCDPTV